MSAFSYQNGARTNLGFLGGYPYAVAYAINDTNQIIGVSDAGIDTHAFEYTNGTMSDLGTLGGMFMGGYSSAHAINRFGQIVGESSLSFSQPNTIHALLWSAGTKTDLGALGGNYSTAYGINSSGVIVGESDIVEQGVTNIHAFIYTNTTMRDLGTLGGNYSFARSINDSGVVVGESDTVIGGATNTHAFIYRNGVMSDLGTFGGSASSANAINSAGQVVGYAYAANELSLAFLYNGTNLVDLNAHIPPGLGWTNLWTAEAINDLGQVVGSGFRADGSLRAYLLTPAGPLLVAITNPAPHSTFSAPATFGISAFVSDTAGLVTNVEFLVNNSVIGNATSAPYNATAANLAAGSYTLTAVASDNSGFKATNSISITVTNNTNSITILDPAFNTAGFSFSFTTQTGTIYYVQFATPFSSSNNWQTFTNLSGNGSVVRVTNSPLTGAQRFYRVLGQ